MSEISLENKQRLEALLYLAGGQVGWSELQEKLDLPEDEIKKLAQSLAVDYEERGVSIVITDTGVSLVTAPAVADFVTKLKKQELEGSLSPAALDTLTIVLYEGSVTKAQVDFIRGVNSATMLRNLLVRGLVDRQRDSDARQFVYVATADLLGFLGITRVEDLSEYEVVRTELKARIETLKEDEKETITETTETVAEDNKNLNQE